MKTNPYKILFLISTILRIILPLAIFRSPLFVVVAITFLDAIDVEFASRKVLTRNGYQRIDKCLDTWWYLVALSFSYFFLNQYFIFLAILFGFRIVGLFVFIIKEDRRVLFFTPNLFENAFFLFFLANHFPTLNFLIHGTALYKSLLAVFILKMIQEYWIHIAQISIPEHIFGKKRLWKK